MQLKPQAPLRSVLRWIPALAAALSLLGSSACSFHFEFPDELEVHNYKHESGLVRLSEVETNDGRTTTYSLRGRPKYFPKGNKPMQAGILVATKAALSVPYLGLDVASVDTSDAEELGIAPWTGVLVTKVDGDSAAAAAELERGDLIVSLNGEAIASEEQFADLVSRALLPGDEAVLGVNRAVAEFAREDLEVPLIVGSRGIEETESDRVDLPLDHGLVSRTGLGLVTVPSDLADEIYGIRQSTPLVSAVVTGSPAYFAGVRAGDRVLRANGEAVETVEDLRLVVDRSGGQLGLQVDGPLGPHSASFEVQDDVLGESDFQIPILVDYESNSDRTNLSILEFIFLFGYSKDVNYYASDTRQVNRRKKISILPLGMFEFTRTPKKKTNRIFWFIEWSSRS